MIYGRHCWAYIIFVSSSSILAELKRMVKTVPQLSQHMKQREIENASLSLRARLHDWDSLGSESPHRLNRTHDPFQTSREGAIVGQREIKRSVNRYETDKMGKQCGRGLKKRGTQGVIEGLGKRGRRSQRKKEKERVRASVWECPFHIRTRRSFPWQPAAPLSVTAIPTGSDSMWILSIVFLLPFTCLFFLD